ncbi:MAG: penicillin acylase family protein [Pirellulaceae bacterium]|nr:penicillin acylase family protein [Pirellulaceae bacterium]
MTTNAVSAAETAEGIRTRAKTVLAPLAGDISLAGLEQPVEVLRDEWGIPHIYAQNQDDMFFAQGFVAAQDRLFQLDMWRRVALGETAEIFGDDAIPADRFARLLLYRGDMQAEWTSYAPDTQAIATAFTAGINACIDQMQGKLPIEFQLAGYAPQRWRPEDILGRMSGIVMVSNWQREVARARLVATVGVEEARRLAPTDPPRDFAPADGLDLAAITPEIFNGYQAATRGLKFPPITTESNNWVVDGALSASGKPMLASDPHRAIGLPSLRYMVHLHAPGWNCIGAGEPALPGIALGHNERIAWGITIVGTDQADLYVEETHPNDPRQYKVDGQWLPMRVIHEEVAVRGRKAPLTLELRYTRHGPVIYQDDKRQVAIALRWAGAEPGGAAYLGGLSVARAQNRQQFVKALESWKVPGLNFAYADVEGQIGWVAAALTPIRDGWDGLLPVPGAAGKHEWRGFLPVAELPQTWNPPSHFVATANHNILPPGYTREIAYEWSSPHRFLRIQERLTEKKQFTLADFQSIQHDSVSLPGRALGRMLAEVELPTELAPFGKLLTEWNGLLSKDSPAGPLYAAWLQELVAGFFGSRLPADTRTERGDLRSTSLLLKQLAEPTAPWFGSEPVKARDELVCKTLAAAVERIKKLLGDDPRDWAWGKLHTASLTHPLASLGQLYEKAFNLGPVSRSGDVHTPNNTRHDDQFNQVHGASFRQVLDLADWDLGMATSVPGQSGQLGSPHYDDLLPLWAEGKYFPLAYSRGMVDKVCRNKLVLQPAERATK